ncbi:ABC transporter [Ceratobasidium sp. AG-Ba]|nr:ABC transporter [Ceratobasidium sp. AG-Ba]
MSAPSVPQEWLYAIQTNEEADTVLRLMYMNTVETLLVLVFSFVFIIIVYQLSGAFVDRCASGLARMMCAMGCNSTAPLGIFFTHGECDARILGSTIGAGSITIFLWLLAASLAEKWMLDPSTGNLCFMLCRLHRRMLPSRGPRVQSELLEPDEPHMPIVTSKPYLTSSAVILDGLTEKFPAARWSAPEYTAVRDLTMAIPSRAIFVLLGANRSGRSTTLKISAPEKQTSGKIEFGEDAYQVTEKARLPTRKGKRPLGLVPQKDILFPELTCYQTLRF